MQGCKATMRHAWSYNKKKHKKVWGHKKSIKKTFVNARLKATKIIGQTKAFCR